MFLNKKIKKIVILFAIVFLFFLFYSTFAATEKNKGIILKKFKELEYKLLFESDTLFLDENARKIFNSSKKYDLYKGIREKVQDKREFLEDEKNKVINKLSNLKDSVILLEKEISGLRDETIKVNNQIIELKRNIKIKSRTVNLLKKKIQINKEILYKYVVYIYKKGNYIFKDGEIDNFKTIFFSGEDISSALNDLYFKGLIETTGRQLIDKHRKYINNLYIEQISLRKSEKETKGLRKQLIIQKAIIKQKKEFKEKLINVSQGKQQIFEKFIGDKLKTEKRIKIKEFIAKLNFMKGKKELLEKEGCNFVDFSKIDSKNIKISGKCKQLNSIIYVESQLKGFDRDDAGNIFKWPVFPERGISTYFNDNGYITMFGEDHEALDIPVAQGTEIKAPADGYVIYVQKPTTMGYSYIALKHTNGLVTVYGHLSEVLVNELDIVKMGDIFAKTGGIPGTKGAGLITTGAHLHFEVWENKKLKDPMAHLNISILKTNNIPSIYFSKYKIDYKARTGNEFKGKITSKRKARTFKITGNDEIERQKNFLNRYGNIGFKNWSLWVEEGIEGNIDPTFLMCVGLAETGLGRSLKTPYNVGNVGNTDSGATKEFSSERDGIAAMTRTFNNKYLGNYNELKLLSRYGNLDEKKPIYASSPDNWHNNIVSCMSYIKGRYISDSYNFRLKQ